MNLEPSEEEIVQKIFESDDYKFLTQKPIDQDKLKALSLEKLASFCKFLNQYKNFPNFEETNKEEMVQKIINYTNNPFKDNIVHSSTLNYLGTVYTSKSEEIIIKTLEEENPPVLDENSKVYLEDKTRIGSISQVFGPVKSPIFLVPKSSSLSIEVGTKVYYSPQDSAFIDVHKIEMEKLEMLKRELSDPDASDDPDENYEEIEDIKLPKRKIDEEEDLNLPPPKKILTEEENLLDELFSIPKPLE